MAKILIVDDSKNICKMVVLTLTHADYEVQSTQDAAQGLNLFGDGSNWDLTLVDQQMPQLQGEEFIVQARQRDPMARLVMMTAFATPHLAAQVIRDGAFDFLSKPFSADVLRQTVATALSYPRHVASDAIYDPNIALPQPGEEGYRMPGISWRINGFSFWPLSNPPEQAIASGFEMGRLFQVRGPHDDFTSCFVGVTPHIRAQIETEIGHTLSENASFWDKVCGQTLLQFLRRSAQTPPHVLPVYERPLLPETRRGGSVSWGAFFGDNN
ncbi:regulatory protein AtoC [Abditibacteriota bacterium]|nr:regulatory protein AtoC [Abditibacteriota bacterium]